MLKKVFLTALCALIITCMAVAVSAAETTVADLNFEDASQVTLFKHFHTATFDPTGGVDGTGALKIEFQTNQRIFDTYSYTWEKGYIYTVSFDAKATKKFDIHFMASFSER